MALDVVVLEKVKGPDPRNTSTSSQIPVHDVSSGAVYYLSNAHGTLLTSQQVPLNRTVRVDGFMRASGGHGGLYNPNSQRYEIANKTWPRGKEIDRFDLIKVRRVYEVTTDGSDKSLWETSVRFRGL